MSVTSIRRVWRVGRAVLPASIVLFALAMWAFTHNHHIGAFHVFGGRSSYGAVQSFRGRVWLKTEWIGHPTVRYVPTEFSFENNAVVGACLTTSRTEPDDPTNHSGSREFVYLVDVPESWGLSIHQSLARLEFPGGKLFWCDTPSLPMPGSGVVQPRVREAIVQLPYWLIAAVAGSGVLVQIWRARRRHRGGCGGSLQCAHCGYDLRAHAAGDKCPECGEVVAAAGRVGM